MSQVERLVASSTHELHAGPVVVAPSTSAWAQGRSGVTRTHRRASRRRHRVPALVRGPTADRAGAGLARSMHPLRGMNRAKPQRFFFRGGDSKVPVTLTLMRVSLGMIMITHGWAKLTDAAAWRDSVVALGIPLPDVAAWLAIVGELFGGLGLLAGLLTPVAAFGVLATMVTAIATVHWGNGLLASNNGFELPLMLAFVAAYFIARGAGPFSLDAVLERRRAAAAEPERRVVRTPQSAEISAVPH